MQDFRVGQRSATLQLRDAILLRPVDRKQAFIDPWVERTGILTLDQLHQRPDRPLVVIPGRSINPAEPVAEARAEMKLFGSRNPLIVQVVVAVGIQETVTQN